MPNRAKSNSYIVLQNTLDWYLERLPPIESLGPTLQGIQDAIRTKDMVSAIDGFSKLYKIARDSGFISKRVTFPGPGKDFQKLATEILEQDGGSNILRDYIKVGDQEYKVLGLVVQGSGNSGIRSDQLFLYNPETGYITGSLRRMISPPPTPRFPRPVPSPRIRRASKPPKKDIYASVSDVFEF